MTFDFITEFYKEKDDETPLYRTHINGIRNEESFINDNGFKEVNDGWYTDWMLETDMEGLQNLVDPEYNPELLAICFEGEPCKRIVIMAYEAEPGSFTGTYFGKDKSLSVSFQGNRNDDSVFIGGERKSFSLPLKRFKEKYDVLTMHEVLHRIVEDYNDMTEADLPDMKKDFAKCSRK